MEQKKFFPSSSSFRRRARSVIVADVDVAAARTHAIYM